MFDNPTPITAQAPLYTGFPVFPMFAVYPDLVAGTPKMAFQQSEDVQYWPINTWIDYFCISNHCRTWNMERNPIEEAKRAGLGNPQLIPSHDTQDGLIARYEFNGSMYTAKIWEDNSGDTQGLDVSITRPSFQLVQQVQMNPKKFKSFIATTYTYAGVHNESMLGLAKMFSRGAESLLDTVLNSAINAIRHLYSRDISAPDHLPFLSKVTIGTPDRADRIRIPWRKQTVVSAPKDITTWAIDAIINGGLTVSFADLLSIKLSHNPGANKFSAEYVFRHTPKNITHDRLPIDREHRILPDIIFDLLDTNPRPTLPPYRESKQKLYVVK